MDEIAEDEPLAPFQRWLDEAWKGEPNAHSMTLATATPDGRPSARMVLLKGLDARGFVFYTNLESRAVLERRVDELSRRFGEGRVSRPTYWSGFRVVPQRVEFWQERPFRLHDRLLFIREGEGWRRGRLFP